MAGFDPARFWDITPRLFALEMDAAADRIHLRMREIWFGAMLPNLKNPPSLEEFSGGRRDRRSEIIRCLAAWDKVDAALAANRNTAA